jgi:hypothetical protein
MSDKEQPICFGRRDKKTGFCRNCSWATTCPTRYESKQMSKYGYEKEGA